MSSCHISTPFGNIKSISVSKSLSARNRLLCWLYLTDGTKKRMDYNRFVKGCGLGRVLSHLEHVSHIDGDLLNCDFSNLMVTTAERWKRGKAVPKPL